MKKEKFAVIFYPFIESYSCKMIAIVDYDEETGEYTIKNGEFANTNQKAFNRIIGSPEFIYGNSDEVELHKENDYVQFAIYIFEDEFIEKLSKENNMNTFDTYVYIYKEVEKIKLNFKKGDERKLIANRRDLSLGLADTYSDEEIKEMLYGRSNIPNNNQPKIDPYFPDKLKNTLYNDKNELPSLSPFVKLMQDAIKESQRIEKESILSITKNIDVAEMIKDINEKIIGQDNAIKTLVTNIYFNQLLIDTLSKNGKIDETELDSRKVSILLDGSTGTGKSAISKDIAQHLKLPFEIVSAASFSETGYVGPTITDVLQKLLNQANGNLKLAERGIIVLDEIDKLATNKEFGRDMKQGVQQELLAFISGGKYDIYVENGGLFPQKKEFDTSQITFILSGAFTDLHESKIKKNEEKFIGFSNGDNKQSNRTYEITPQDYIDYGLMREFFGRIKVLAHTKTYTKEDLRNILLNSKISALTNFEKTVKMYGYKGILYNDEFLNAVVDYAYEMNTGARALQTIMSGIQDIMLYQLTMGEYDKNDLIELTTELLDKYKKSNIRSY